ncbi:TPA: hypothetical protein DGH83_03700 [Candidatus Peregrinibacteria bacterium]|nr:hypothetical protein [Candidatus Peregrinibacteria bacterium]
MLEYSKVENFVFFGKFWQNASMALNNKKVYFYTGNFTHNFYKEIYRHAPDGFSFIPSSKDLVSTGIKKDIIKSSQWWGNVINKAVFHAAKLMALSRIPNLKIIKIPKEADLVHSAQAMLLNHRPWVVDFEDISVFGWYSPKLLGCSWSKKIMQHCFESDACRLILPWTLAAKKSLLNALDCEKFKNKIEIAYPVKEPNIPFKPKEKKPGEPINLLQIGTAFYTKGCHETLLAFEKIQNKYNVHLTVISIFPEDIKNKFGSNPKITLLSRVSNERIKQAYEEADIFVYPVHNDTFGFVILEAYGYGLPCISTHQFAIPEIVIDNETGLLIPPYVSRFNDRFLPQYPLLSGLINEENHPLSQMLKNPPDDYVNHLIKAMVTLIENSSLRNKMSEKAYQMVSVGRFSSQARKKRMKELYQRALAF